MPERNGLLASRAMGISRAALFSCLAAGALATIDGCAIVPRDTPSGESLRANAAAVSGDRNSFRYAMVELSDARVDRLNAINASDSGTSSFPRSDRGSTALLVDSGDFISITIYEATAEVSTRGLFAPGDASQHLAGGAATIPNQQVDSNGDVEIPFVGSVRVAGRTPNQVGALIAKRLSQRALEPQVVVSIVDRRGNAVSVLGDVVSPIHFPIDPDGVTLLQAIARSGGTKSQAFETEVVLRRGSGQYRANLGDLLNDHAHDTHLRGGDVVFLIHRPRFITIFGAASDASNTSITHRVTFEADTMTLSEALGKVNGLSDTRADPAQVFLLRTESRATLRELGIDTTGFDGDSIPAVFSVNLNGAEGLFAANHLLMRSQDLVVAADAQSTDVTKLFNIVNSVAAPFASEGERGRRIPLGLPMRASMIGCAAWSKWGRLACFGLIFLTGTSFGFAKCSQTASPESLRNFIQHPGDLLDSFPIGGPPLRVASELFVTASSESMVALASVIARANFRQKQAIGYGFAAAYNACRFQRPSFAQDIDRFARTVPDGGFVRMYLIEAAAAKSPDVGVNSSGAVEAGSEHKCLGKDLGLRENPDPKLPLSLPGTSCLDN